MAVRDLRGAAAPGGRPVGWYGEGGAVPAPAFVCDACGTRYEKWRARCRCGAWNSGGEAASPPAVPPPDPAPPRVATSTPPRTQASVPSSPEAIPSAPSRRSDARIPPARVPEPAAPEEPLLSVPVPITEVAVGDEHVRRSTGIEPLDRVLGGGLVLASFVLLGGDPGIGKSTLLAQMLARTCADRILYATGEETIEQVAMRARRVGSADPKIRIVQETNVARIMAHADGLDAQIVAIDSIQTTFDPEISSAAGRPAQINGCSARLMRFAKATGRTLVAVCHITKDGDLAGLKALEHWVDVILQFEKSEECDAIRYLRCVGKNRYGSTAEVGGFEMGPDGLRPMLREEMSEESQRSREDPTDALLPIAQELAYRVLELGGDVDEGLRARIADRLDLAPRGSR